jgi:hypothetical protein
VIVLPPNRLQVCGDLLVKPGFRVRNESRSAPLKNLIDLAALLEHGGQLSFRRGLRWLCDARVDRAVSVRHNEYPPEDAGDVVRGGGSTMIRRFFG